MAKAAAKAKSAPKRAPKRASKPAAKSEARTFTLPKFQGFRRNFESQLAANLGEERLLAYVAFACFATYLLGLPTAIRVAEGMEGENAVLAHLAGRFVAVVIFGPLFLYGVAALSHLIAAYAFGGQGTFKRARLALFWSLVLGVPLGLLNLAGLWALEQLGLSAHAETLGIAVFFTWLWIWASCLAMAEGFSRIATFGLCLVVGFCIIGVGLLMS